MKKMVGFLILAGLGLALSTACSSGASSSPSPSSLQDNQKTSITGCQELVSEMTAQNGSSPMTVLQSFASAADRSGMSVDQAADCLDKNLQLQCSATSCLLQERN